MILHYRDYHARAASSCRERALPLYRENNQKKEFTIPPPGRGSSYGGAAREYRNEVLQRDGDEIPFRYQCGQDTVRGCGRTITVQILRMHAQWYISCLGAFSQTAHSPRIDGFAIGDRCCNASHRLAPRRFALFKWHVRPCESVSVILVTSAIPETRNWIREKLE